MIHDSAYRIAQAILATVKDCLYEHEHRDAFQEFYEIARRNLETYETEVDRMKKRLKPSSN
jgi:hypothetical protein